MDVCGSDGEEGVYTKATKDNSLEGFSLRQKLRDVGLQEVDTPPDGHCGFWSMCFLLGLVQCGGFVWHVGQLSLVCVCVVRAGLQSRDQGEEPRAGRPSEEERGVDDGSTPPKSLTVL